MSVVNNFFNKLAKRTYIELFILFLAGMIPLLWLRNNQVVLGHDSGLTLYPIDHFFDRLFVWTDRFSFGSDQTFGLAGLLIHGLEALIMSFVQSVHIQQKTLFVFWFLLPGLTMYYFASQIAREYKLKYFALPVSLFYMINYFLLQGWFIAERTKFSLYAALPLLFSLLFSWRKKKISTFVCALLISLVLFFLNGAGSLPLYGGIIISIIVFTVYYSLLDFSLRTVISFIKLFATTALLFVVFNAYWILPYGFYVFHHYQESVAQAGGQAGVFGWADYISTNTSLINLLRLQGIPEWYQNPLHPYARAVTKNPLLVVVATFLPILAFSSLLLYKKRKTREIIICFSSIALVTILFVAGTHPPFGFFYKLMLRFIPGFIAFRTPFYKFGPALWFSYALLLGFSINYITVLVKKKNHVISYALYVLVCTAIVLYSFPFMSGVFFDYMKGVRSTRITVPEYVYKFAEWSSTPERASIKTITVPPLNNSIEAYTWGYWSLAPLTSLITNAPIINIGQYMSPYQRDMLVDFYRLMRNNAPGWKKMARLLDIQSFLVRNDIAWDQEGSKTDNPEWYKTALSDPDIIHVASFGKWDVYDLKRTSQDENPINIYSSINTAIGDNRDIGIITSLPIYNEALPLYISKDIPDELISISSSLYAVADCVTCNLLKEIFQTSPYVPLLTRGSKPYPFLLYKHKMDEKRLSYKSPHERAKHYLYDSVRHMLAMQKIIDSSGSVEDIYSTAEDYIYALQNLKSSLIEYVSSNSTSNEFLVVMNNALLVNEILLLKNSEAISDKDTLKLIDQSYAEVKKLKDIVKSNVWQTTTPENKRLTVAIPEKGEYTILYRPNNSAQQQAEEVSYTINNKQYTKPANPIRNGWLGIGKMWLFKGQHKLEIQQQAENLYIGEDPITIQSDASGKCSTLISYDFKNGETYRLTFEHIRKSGGQTFKVRTLTNELANPFDKSGNILRPNYNYWQKFEAIYSSDNNNEFARISICNYPYIDIVNSPSSITLQNVKLTQVAVPDVVFVKSMKMPNFYTKYTSYGINQTIYSAYPKAIRSPSVVTLNESYSSDWLLDESMRSLMHFEVDGYKNAWLMNEIDDKNLTITYRIQPIFYYGVFISIASIILAAGTIITLNIKKHNRYG